MPLSINVGLSRKASKDYQSTGVSINVTAELDQSLLAKPDELQQQVAYLYDQAEQALDRQAGDQDRGNTTPTRRRATQISRSNGYSRNGNGSGNGHHSRSNGNGGGMTESQRRAISAIADRLNVDPVLESRDVLGAELENLSVRQASELIDHLKSIQPSGNGR